MNGLLKTLYQPGRDLQWPLASIVDMGKRAGPGRYAVLVCGESRATKPGYYATIERAREHAVAWLALASA